MKACSSMGWSVSSCRSKGPDASLRMCRQPWHRPSPHGRLDDHIYMVRGSAGCRRVGHGAPPCRYCSREAVSRGRAAPTSKERGRRPAALGPQARGSAWGRPWVWPGLSATRLHLQDMIPAARAMGKGSRPRAGLATRLRGVAPDRAPLLPLVCPPACSLLLLQSLRVLSQHQPLSLNSH